jgi:hypothetical protein
MAERAAAVARVTLRQIEDDEYEGSTRLVGLQQLDRTRMLNDF